MFPMLMAGTMFGRFITMSRLPSYFTDLILTLNVHPLIIFTLVIIFLVFCGCLMDLMTIIIITTPIVFPLLTSLGFDPYALCIVLVFMICIAGMTPPVGIGVFTVANVAEVDPMYIFKSVWPYVLAQIAVSYFIVCMPQCVTFLWNLMG